MFKANIAARDRHQAQAKPQPPTVEAVRMTVLKLAAMVEKRSKDVGYLEEKLRWVRWGGRVEVCWPEHAAHGALHRRRVEGVDRVSGRHYVAVHVGVDLMLYSYYPLGFVILV